MYFHKCCQCCFTKQWIWFSGCFKKHQIWSSMCSHCVFNKHWMDFHIMLCCCFNILHYCAVSFGSVCDISRFHYSLSKSSACNFPCAVTAYSVSCGWIFICCPCCFTKQWHCSVSKNNECRLLCVLTAHLISSGWISLCCHCCFTMLWLWFSTCCHYLLSKKAVDLVFCMLSLHTCCLYSLRNQWMQLCLCCTAYLVSSGWISTSCPCCFTSQWIWFSMFCHYTLS